MISGKWKLIYPPKYAQYQTQNLEMIPYTKFTDHKIPEYLTIFRSSRPVCVLPKNCFEKFCKIRRKTHISESLLVIKIQAKRTVLMQNTSLRLFLCPYREIKPHKTKPSFMVALEFYETISFSEKQKNTKLTDALANKFLVRLVSFLFLKSFH